MRSKQEILEWVRGVLRREFQFCDEELLPATRLLEDLDLDSIDAIDIAVRMEEELGVEIEEADLKALRTLEDVVELVRERSA
jgi:acyl carrier protein